MKYYLFVFIFYAQFSLAIDLNCEVSEAEIERFVKMDFKDFNQSEDAWRLLVTKSCYKQAALVQEIYRKRNFNKIFGWQKRILSWHIGQMHSFDRNYPKAIKNFRMSLNLRSEEISGFRWNDYVNASIAFLEADRDKLSFYRNSLYQGDSPYNRINLRIVDSFLRCFGSSYWAAYSLDCNPEESENDRLRATAIRVESLKKFDDSLIEYFKKHDLIAVGEIHGNQESIDLFESLVRSLKSPTDKMLVALEIPRNEQARLDQFLKTSDVEVLKDSEFFNGKFQDGRSSKAMLGLLQKLARIKNIKLLYFDYVGSGDSQTRDLQMASLIFDEIRANEYERSLILTGGVHASLKKATSWDLDYVPMFRALEEKFKKANINKRLLNIGLKYRQLNTWACFNSECKAHIIEQPDSPYSEAVDFSYYFTLEDSVSEQGYMSSFFIRETSASVPVFQKN